MSTATQPLGDLIEAHVEHLRVQRRLAPRTVTMYREAFARLVALCAEHGVDPLEVGVPQVRRWTAGLHAQGLAPRSIAIVLSAWRGLYRQLGREGRVRLNPVDGVRAPKAPRPLPKALAVDQAVALAESAHAQAEAQAAADPRQQALALRDAAIIELLYGSGLRVGEVVGLDLLPGGEPLPTGHAPGWVNLADGSVQVVGKGGKARSVPLGTPAVQALKDWLAARALLARPDERALFVGARGQRLDPRALREALARRGHQAGLPTQVHPHMLRHSFASHLLQSSGDLRGVQELLGHAHIATTQVYTRLDFGHLSRVYDAAHPRARKKSP